MKLLQFSFRPYLVTSLKTYTRDDFQADLVAGFTVAIIALPLALAYGVASGARPEQGVVAAIIGGFLISLLGGSRVQVGGPAGALIALLYSVAVQYGVANLLIATIMSGVLLFALGAFKLGSLIRFIPISIVIGFTSGIAVIIITSQLSHFLGLSIPKVPANFFSQISAIWQYRETFNWVAASVGLLSLLLIVLWPVRPEARVDGWRYLAYKLPSTLAVLIIAAFAVWLFDLPVQTIGTRFGDLPSGLPFPSMPVFDWATVQNLATPAIAITLLVGIESLLTARKADSLIEDRHDPNQELMAQGIANFFVPWFGGITVAGTAARTVTNVRSGARSPVAGIVHALALLVFVLFLAPLARYVPFAALAAILLWVAFRMGDWQQFARLRHFSNFYRATMLSGFLLTVVFNIVVAVEVGLVLSSLFFIYRISSLTKVEAIVLPPDVTALPGGRRLGAWRLYGSLFFGSIPKMECLLDPACVGPEVVVLEMDHVIHLDANALKLLLELRKSLRRRHGRLFIVGAQEQALGTLRMGGMLDAPGDAALLPSLDAALAAAREWAAATPASQKAEFAELPSGLPAEYT